jgi:hypothetical protein
MLKEHIKKKAPPYPAFLQSERIGRVFCIEKI